jgi:hypothetical protein
VQRVYYVQWEEKPPAPFKILKIDERIDGKTTNIWTYEQKND